MLQTVSGNAPEAESTILVNRATVSSFDACHQPDRPFDADSDRMIQQAGLQWTVSRLLMAIAVGALVGAVLGMTFHPLGFTLLSVLALALLLGGLPYLYVRYKRNKRDWPNRRAASRGAGLSGALDARGTRVFDQSRKCWARNRRIRWGRSSARCSTSRTWARPSKSRWATSAERVPLLDVRLLVSVGFTAEADRRQFERSSDAAGVSDSRAVPTAGPGESGQRARAHDRPGC